MVNSDEKQPKESDKKEEVKKEKKIETKTSETIKPKECADSSSRITNFCDYLQNLCTRLKEKNISADFLKSEESEASKMFANIEEKTRELFKKIEGIIQNFMEKDLEKLKKKSKKDFESIQALLNEYKVAIEKNANEQLKLMSDIKVKLQEKLMTAEEFKGLVKPIETKFMELKKLTSDLMESMKKPEWESFKRNLVGTMNESCTKIMSSLNNFFNNFKDKLDEKPFFSKLKKFKIPQIQSKLFTPAPGGSKSNGLTVDKPKIPPIIMEKLNQLKSKGFELNSHTPDGRANVAKVTILTTFLVFVYWRWRRSKSQ